MAQVQNKSSHNQVDEVGQILVKVQEDLQQLKDEIDLLKLSGNTSVNFKPIDDALKRTKNGIQKNSDFVFNLLNNTVQTLPAITYVANSSSFATSSSLNDNQEIFINSKTYLPENSFQPDLTFKALIDSENLNNSTVLNKSYALSVLPKIKSKTNVNQLRGQKLHGTTTAPLTVLPPANRKDPSLPIPPIEEKDAKKGILSLLQRGLIPHTAEITLDPAPVNLKRLVLHDHHDSNKQSTYHNDSCKGDHRFMKSAKNDLDIQTLSSSYMKHENKKYPSENTYTSKETLSLKLYELPLDNSNQNDDKNSEVVSFEAKKLSNNHNLQIIKGVIQPSDKLSLFKQKNFFHLVGIQEVLDQISNLCSIFSIPVAHVNMKRLVELASQYDLEQNPNKYELISVLDNHDEVTSLMLSPGRRYLAADGKDAAATTIQSTYRRFTARKKYLVYRKQRWAAALIAVSWLMSRRRANFQNKVKVLKTSWLHNYKIRRKSLATNWKSIQSGPRVVLHVPSFSYSQQSRLFIDNFHQFQNYQIGRIFDILDQNVHIIYVTPTDLEGDLESYYEQMLNMRASVESGTPEVIEKLQDRVTFVYPENAIKFMAYNLSLAKVLYYSPNALNRIKMLIQGQNAYYVPGFLSDDDLAVTDFLNIPIFGSEPNITQLYSNKSGSKRVFKGADVAGPPGDFDIYTANQLNESLAKLICSNPNVTKWLIKIDNTFDGRGIAVFDVKENLPCYGYMMKQVKKFGDKWKFKWAQEEVLSQILYQLPVALDTNADTVDKSVYPVWVSFLDEYLRVGGVIEACPPSESTAITVDMTIEPTGVVKMNSCGDQIHAESPFKCYATTVPQTSVDPEKLSGICNKIAVACRDRGVIGHFSVDFVTFIDEKTLEQKVWATDLTLHYSDQLALTTCMTFISRATFNASAAILQVPASKPEPKLFKEVHDDNQEEQQRYAVLSSKLFHTNLQLVHQHVFLLMCKSHGIGFDVRDNSGTFFVLYQTEVRNKIGMVVISESLTKSLKMFASNLSSINQEIANEKTKGKNNFTVAIQQLDSLLKGLKENEVEET